MSACLVLEVDRSVEVRNLGVDRLAHNLAFASVHEGTHLCSSSAHAVQLDHERRTEDLVRRAHGLRETATSCDPPESVPFRHFFPQISGPRTSTATAAEAAAATRLETAATATATGTSTERHVVLLIYFESGRGLSQGGSSSAGAVFAFAEFLQTAVGRSSARRNESR